ncbi:MAG: hypothetical protein IPP78_02630 [Holophagaceae bacterium]|nr:hypothetical protein [Holophagaceae bacterium]
MLRAAADRGLRSGTLRALVLLPKPGMLLQWQGGAREEAFRGSRIINGTTALLELPVPAAFKPNGWIHFEVVDEGRLHEAKVMVEGGTDGARLTLSLNPDREDFRPNETMHLRVNASGTTALSVGVVDEAIYALAPEILPDPASILNPRLPDGASTMVIGTGQTQAAMVESSWVEVRREKPWTQTIKLPNGKSRTIPVEGATVVVQASAAQVDTTSTTASAAVEVAGNNYSMDGMAMLSPGVVGTRPENQQAQRALSALREHFLDTALWIPNLVVKDRSTVDVPLPEDLTAWRATAVGFTADGRSAIARATVRVNKPLQVNLVIPQVLTEGDESRALVLLQNRSKKRMQGQLVLDVKGGTLLDGPRQPFDLKAGEERRLAFRLEAEKGQTQLVLKAGAATDHDQDGEKRELKILRPGIELRTQEAVALAGGEIRRSFTVPEWGEVTGTLSLFGINGGLEQLSAPSLKYMIHYPYGCVEQTLSSFVPNILVAELVKKGLMPPLNGKEFEELDVNIQQGVQRVYGYQMDNGGWGWYGPKDFGASANPHTTGYAVMALAAMKRMGYTVDENRLHQGLSATRLLLSERMAHAKDGKAEDSAKARGDVAFLLSCLAQADAQIMPDLDAAIDAVLKADWPGDGLLALVSHAAVLVQHGRTKALLDALEKRAHMVGDAASWSGSDSPRYSYLSGDVYTTVAALRALCLGRPGSKLIPAGEAYLMANFQGNGWNSTWVTSQVVALLPDLAKVRRIQWEGAPIKVQVEGGPSFDLTDASKPATLDVKGGQSISLVANGRGVLVYVLSTSSQKPMLSPAAGGLLLQAKRTLWKLEAPKGTSRLGWTKKPWDSALKLHDEAYLEVDVSSNQWISYGLVEVPVPPGFEASTDMQDFVLDGQDMAALPKPARTEVHPDHVAFLLYYVGPNSTAKLRLRLRAKLEGRYRLRPVKFSLMGDESLWCSTETSTITIEGGAK